LSPIGTVELGSFEIVYWENFENTPNTFGILKPLLLFRGIDGEFPLCVGIPDPISGASPAGLQKSRDPYVCVCAKGLSERGRLAHTKGEG
jgi:hypothetical protein